MKWIKISLDIISSKETMEILALLSRLAHPNVLPIIGYFSENDGFSDVCTVSKWMENGNVKQYMMKHLCGDAEALKMVRKDQF